MSPALLLLTLIVLKRCFQHLVGCTVQNGVPYFDQFQTAAWDNLVSAIFAKFFITLYRAHDCLIKAQ